MKTVNNLWKSLKTSHNAQISEKKLCLPVHVSFCSLTCAQRKACRSIYKKLPKIMWLKIVSEIPKDYYKLPINFGNPIPIWLKLKNSVQRAIFRYKGGKPYQNLLDLTRRVIQHVNYQHYHLNEHFLCPLL